MTTTWKRQILKEMVKYQENWDDVVAMTISDQELDVAFDSSFGSSEGIPFTLWTKKRVYFPAVYDGAEWVVSVSRNPNGIPTPHIGGQ